MQEKKPVVIFVLGGPGSGKGTQCSNLVREFGFVHLSAGELLREERDSGSENGELINHLMKEGKIVPSEITVRLLCNAMEKNGWAAKKFLIDGFPRNEENFTNWQALLQDKIDFRFVLVMECTRETMTKRILGRGQESGRVDDNLASLLKRFDVFEKDTKFVIDFYSKLNKVIRVDGEMDPEAVFKDLQAQCGDLLN